MNRRIVASVLIALLVAVVGTATAAEKILKVAQVADIDTLDPHRGTDIYSANIMKQIYNNLVVLDHNMDIQLDLAESWETPDDNTWIFRLKQGVKFHNGEELTAHDVKFSIERIQDPDFASPGAWHVEQVIDVEVVDNYTVKLTTKNPFAPLLNSLARYELSIMNEKAVTEGGEDYARHPIGTGPFKFEQRFYGDRIILSRFDDYFEGPAHLDGIVYRAIPEDATRVIELESGGLDLMYNLPPQEFDRLSKNASLKIYETLGQMTEYIGLNTTVKPLDNKKVRQALNWAVDKQAVVDAVFFGHASPSYGPISPSIWGFDDSLERAYPYNPEKAKELLAEAGYANGFEMTIWTDPRTERKSSCELVQAYLAQVGIKANIEILEWSTLLAATSDGSDGGFIFGYVGTGDADGGLYPRFHSSNIGGSNRYFWASDELDQFLDEGRITLDLDARKDIYKDAQAHIIDNAIEIFLVVSQNLAASRQNIDGFIQYPSNINPLYNVRFVD